MWIYEQTGTETALLPLAAEAELPVPAADADNLPMENAATPEAPNTMQQSEVKPEPEKRRRTKTLSQSSRDCWLLAAAFLLGSTAAGALQALFDARQAELLRYYLEAWRALFTAGNLQNAVHLFGAEYFTLGIVVSLFLLLGLSALGPLLIFGCMMLYGLGSGLLLVQISAAEGWQAILPALLWTGIPAAAASGCLCLFGASALQVSGRIRAYSFWNRSAGQARPGVQALLGQYLLTMVLLLPLCGAAAGLSYLGARF